MNDKEIYFATSFKNLFKHYKVRASGNIPITTKKTLKQALELGIQLFRRDKITGLAQTFDYKTNKWK